MSGNSLSQRKAQLDKAEREHLEDIVAEMRERVEDNVRFQLTQANLDTRPSDDETLDEENQQFVDAIELEAVDDTDWDEAFEEYVDGVGYTIVNRLAALRCMEVRDFIAEEVTVFKENGLTPAAETLVHEEFLLEDEAILAAYHNTCDELAAEIEILFDRSSAYSLVDPDDDTFEELCGKLDEVPDEVWRADDVLGWVYEYYNRSVVEALDAKNTLEPEDVGPANQFYTPHWVVRMLTDNSLGKLYLEATNQESTVSEAESLSIEDRKERLVTPEDAPSVAELCTYLIPDEDEQEAPEFDHPSELRVIDPACGSGHFLLYAFDILERIWWAETDLDRCEIPAKILEHNLYGVDIDLRSCQLSAFNLYLKARTRAEAEDNTSFKMPNVGIVCADARVAEVEEAVGILDEIAGDGTEVREVLDGIIQEFQSTEALGSLLDVQGTLSEEFMESQTDIVEWGGEGPHTLNEFLKQLRKKVEEQTSDSFGEQNLRSFLNLLVVLTQNYDVSLMNPPYGSGGRMPAGVKEYVSDRYEYVSEYYINFFESCDRLTKPEGRIGMLIPRSFMFLKSFQEFREDFIGGQGSFDFLAEYGIGVLDNATVRTAGIVVRSGTEKNQKGTFFRLNDLAASEKEDAFIQASFVNDTTTDGIQRKYQRDLSEFSMVPGTPLTYWVSKDLRSLYDSEVVLDAEKGQVDAESFGSARVGLQTSDDDRFTHKFWENFGSTDWIPFAKGGEDAWLLPRTKRTVLWSNNGTEVKRFPTSQPRNKDDYFSEALTYTVAKESGRRFGYMHPKSVFGHKGSVIIPKNHLWHALSYTTSHLFTYLMLTQTTERMWESGQVSKVPWSEKLENIDELGELSKKAVSYLISKRQYDFDSPFYSTPVLLSVLGLEDSLPQYEHPHRELRDDIKPNIRNNIIDEDDVDKSCSLEEIGIAAAKHLERINKNLYSCADLIDSTVFESFNISEMQQENILQEIALRTNNDPRDLEEYDPEAISEPTEEFPEMVKDLLLHLTLRIVDGDDDGIVPISDVDDETDLLTRIENEFERLFGDHATARLAEVDHLLGSQTADKEAYPNLQTWLEEDLFEYHVSTFDRTPILWQLTTSRLVSDPEGEGFACLVDYHQLDAGVFDRLQNRYLEPRKTLLRERRSAANRRRSDNSLTTAEKAAAANTYTQCESGLEQIGIFEDQLIKLTQPTPRDWSKENQRDAQETIKTLREFREQTESRLDTLEELAKLDDVNMEDLFTQSFYDKVQNNQDEWLDGLNDLEFAFEAYSNDPSKPVPAHLYDLFEYYDGLIGSTHFASNGILFMTYYFDKFDDAEQAQISESNVSKRQRLLFKLASGLEEYIGLAEEIAKVCESLASDESTNWTDRALSEITTGSYQPNYKHGVKINITPLVEAKIVPKIVENRVI